MADEAMDDDMREVLDKLQRAKDKIKRRARNTIGQKKSSGVREYVSGMRSWKRLRSFVHSTSLKKR